MGFGAAVLAASLAVAQSDMPVTIVHAPGSPVRLDRAKILNTGDQPLVLLYAATNTTDDELEQFVVTVMVFDREGRLRARQVAPGRRTLEARGTKYSAMVLDVGKIEPTDTLMAGVGQAQRAGSDQWWRADVRELAEEAVKRR